MTGAKFLDDVNSYWIVKGPHGDHCLRGYGVCVCVVSIIFYRYSCYICSGVCVYLGVESRCHVVQ